MSPPVGVQGPRREEGEIVVHITVLVYVTIVVHANVVHVEFEVQVKGVGTCRLSVQWRKMEERIHSPECETSSFLKYLANGFIQAKMCTNYDLLHNASIPSIFG